MRHGRSVSSFLNAILSGSTRNLAVLWTFVGKFLEKPSADFDEILCTDSCCNNKVRNSFSRVILIITYYRVRIKPRKALLLLVTMLLVTGLVYMTWEACQQATDAA